MMKKTWQTWMIFLLFVGVVLTVMAWISTTVLRLEKHNAEIQRKAAGEEVIRLALWRMDAAISPLIIEESSRPYFDYWAYNRAEDIYPSLSKENAAEILPSPLLVKHSDSVNVYFNGIVQDESTLAGEITSPQVPELKMADWPTENFTLDDTVILTNSARLQIFTTNILVSDLQEALRNVEAYEPFPLTAGTEYQYAMSRPASPSPISRDDLNQLINGDEAREDMASGPLEQSLIAGRQQRDTVSQSGRQAAEPQISADAPAQQGQFQRNSSANPNDYASRRNWARKAGSKIALSKQELYKFQEANKDTAIEAPPGKSEGTADHYKAPGKDARYVDGKKKEAADLGVREGVMHLMWVNNFLVLARKVKIDGKTMIQGAWLNWDHIRKELLGEIADILPDADLVQVEPTREPDKSRILAAVPARLIPGTPAVLPPLIRTPLRLPLLAAWACIILAAFAVALLLFGTVSLSERRAAFVSAVTHELRTPLTTFRMYTEMLANGMIKDKAKSQSYLETLHSESNRLAHLVENILAYARLERGVGSRTMESIAIGAIIDRAKEHMSARSLEVNMDLVVDIPDSDRTVRIDTDRMAVEQILFNLVDNACKYSANAEDRRIHLAVTADSALVRFRVCDHGPGLKRSERATAFKPFRKSVEKAAQSAPGVGLGLSLSRQLARQLGGSLSYEEHPGYGACFVLALPCATA